MLSEYFRDVRVSGENTQTLQEWFHELLDDSRGWGRAGGDHLRDGALQVYRGSDVVRGFRFGGCLPRG